MSLPFPYCLSIDASRSWHLYLKKKKRKNNGRDVPDFLQHFKGMLAVSVDRIRRQEGRERSEESLSTLLKQPADLYRNPGLNQGSSDLSAAAVK